MSIKATGRIGATALVAVAAFGLSSGRGHAQTVSINGIGDALPQSVYQQEFTSFTSVTPNVIFNYQVSASAVSTFLTDVAYQYAATEIPLTSAQIAAYTRTPTNGALIQIPMFGLAVTIPFNNTERGLAHLTLTDTELCGVLSGLLTDWSQISAGSGTINVIYRSDADSTSELLTRHLNAVCTAENSKFGSYPVPITATFAQVFANNRPPANFTAANGAPAASSALVNTALSLGYLTPDYTSIAPHSPHTTSLKVASLVNPTNNVAYSPGTKNITLGLANPSPGSQYITPPATQQAAANQLDWIPVIATTKAGYPIVGYADWLLVTCTGNKTLDSDLTSFLTDHYTVSGYAQVRANSGFVSVPKAWSTAVRSIILSNKKKYGLNIGYKGACKNG